MSETTPFTIKSKKDPIEKPSPSAQILSNVELLVAMCEEQERAATAAVATVDTQLIEAAVGKSVNAAVNDTVARVVQTAVVEALSGSLKKNLEGCFSQFNQRMAQLDDRINQVAGQLEKIDTNSQAFNTRFDSLDEKIDSAPQQGNAGSAEKNSQLETKFDMIGSALANVMLLFENKFASMERTFQDQCKTSNGFHAKISAADSPKTDASATPIAEEKEAVPVGDDSTVDWQQQRQAILAQYDAPEDQPLDQAKADANSENPTAHTPATSSDEVEQLKSQLEAKLREAEVEMSINRARLSQERAEVERNQASLDRRAAKLESKLAAIDNNDDDDPMSRFKRHLGS